VTGLPDAEADLIGPPNDDPWYALVMRSKLDSTVWIPSYGGDQSCYEWAGPLRRVKAHVESYAPTEDGRYVWYRRDPNTWLWMPEAAARAYLTGAQ
jgi:hypothetical protein